MSRRDQILEIAAELFARHGFHGVSIADLGKACGVSGPALYKHFDGKQDLLAQMLVSISDELLSEGQARVAAADSSEQSLAALIAWHVDFALKHRALIVVQDRDWAALPDDSREQVRKTQRAYVDLWVDVVRKLVPGLSAPEAKARVHAVFGLINSTPHSAVLPEPAMRTTLATMARAALTA